MNDVVFSPVSAVRTELGADDPLAASVSRLARSDYETRAVLDETTASDWPGDIAGRLLLTLSRQARAGHGDQERLDELFEAVLEGLEPNGHFGPTVSDVVDEQQVACHGWVVSGLLQFGALRSDARAAAAARRVVEALILPALGRLDSYPRHRMPHALGAASGTATFRTAGWVLSSDTWCVMLTLNALVPYFEIDPRDDVRAAIETLLEMLDGVDLVAQGAQLHATLAAARNLAAFAASTGNVAARDRAIALWDAYATRGRTLNWATFNWFGRPDSWTEPCAIVDSVLLGLSLYDLTSDPRYLDEVAFIEANGLGFAEREDGSFGLDSVATPEEPTIAVIHPDARWCCTMRGGLGLMALRDGSYRARGGELEVLLPRTARVVDAGWEVEFTLLDADVLEAVVRATPAGGGELHGPRIDGGVRVEPRPEPYRVALTTFSPPPDLADGSGLEFVGADLLVDTDDEVTVRLRDAPKDVGRRTSLIRSRP